MSATMTLIGLNDYDPTIFNGLVFPAGIDKDIAVNEILIRSGEFEILYPDPNFLKFAIEHWGKKHYRTFEKWVEALNEDFNPLYNYDRYEEFTDSKTAQGNTKANSNSVGNTVDNSTESESSNDRSNSASQTSTDSNTGETKSRGVSAYDSSNYQPREEESTTGTSGQKGSGAAQNESESSSSKTGSNIASSSSSNEQNTLSNNTEQSTHTAHLYGNIGVTTSTQMLEDFLRVERFSIYEQIADIFVDEFCIMIY